MTIGNVYDRSKDRERGKLGVIIKSLRKNQKVVIKGMDQPQVASYAVSNKKYFEGERIFKTRRIDSRTIELKRVQ